MGMFWIFYLVAGLMASAYFTAVTIDLRKVVPLKETNLQIARDAFCVLVAWPVFATVFVVFTWGPSLGVIWRGLQFFYRIHSNGYPTNQFGLASYHPEWSITWLWALYWQPSRKFWFHGWRKNGHGVVNVAVPLLGRFDVHWQEAMPNRVSQRAIGGVQ